MMAMCSTEPSSVVMRPSPEPSTVTYGSCFGRMPTSPSIVGKTNAEASPFQARRSGVTISNVNDIAVGTLTC